MKSMLLKEDGVALKNQMMMIKKIAQTKMPILDNSKMLKMIQTVMKMTVRKSNGKNNNNYLPN